MTNDTSIIEYYRNQVKIWNTLLQSYQHSAVHAREMAKLTPHQKDRKRYREMARRAEKRIYTCEKNLANYTKRLAEAEAASQA